MTKDWSTLTQWTEKAIGRSDVRVQVRLRGNHLHVLCEASPCPREKTAVSQFSAALAQTRLETLLPTDAPPVYKVFLCGRLPGAKRPEWTVKLECSDFQPQPETSGISQSSSSQQTSKPSVLEKLTGIFTHRTSHKNDSEFTKATETSSESISVIDPQPDYQQNDETVFAIANREEASVATPQPIENLTPKPLLDSPVVEKDWKRQIPRPQPPELHRSERSEDHGVHSTRSHLAGTATQTQPEQSSSSKFASAQITVSPEILARQGYSHAIASDLSEILGNLGVSVRVSIKELSKKRRPSPDPHKEALTRRLWVRLESAYSPDPSLLAEPIAQRLRQLQLENFRDACIFLQVQGEPTPDWMLRIDLTPPLQILKDWARWGSDAAITRLINQKLEEFNVKVRATLKESTLHIFCETRSVDTLPEKSNKRHKNKRHIPAKHSVMTAIAPILETLAPQGILAATVYGVEGQNAKKQPQSPGWVDWLNLPAAQHPDLQPHPLTLAQQGNLEALTFLLNQIVNPDLESKLATGGVRVLLLRKGKLLHVMTEAPTCPSQSKVAPPLAEFLRTYQIDDIAGVRIYGRRAGQKHPLWRYGVALSQRVLTPDEQVNAFSEAEGEHLISQPDGLVFRPDLASDEEGNESLILNRLSFDRSAPLEFLSLTVQQQLLATGLFSSRQSPDLVDSSKTARYSKMGLAFVWAGVGCLLAIQLDWVLGQFLENNPQFETSTEQFEAPMPRATLSRREQMAAIQTASPEDDGVFNRSDFISDQESLLLYPSFNSPQLDEQLARYQDFLLREKRPPDILIVGSSRALRGIDPAVLETALAEQGYPQLRVFNFGVNGATAQIVDLVVRRILPPEQLPQLIIVADGVRALNSGRGDRTYEALAGSAGYQELAQGTFRIPTRQLDSSSDFQNTLLTIRELGQNPSNAVKQVQQWFDQQLMEISAAYRQRDHLKQFLLLMVNNRSFNQSSQDLPDVPEVEEGLKDETPQLASNGFLPLSIRFDPETYYQKHSQVSGYYDSDYQGFELTGIQSNALRRLIDYVQSQQIEIVFVNMPLTQDYLDSVRTAYEQKFQEYMQQVERETGLTFIDLAWEWLETYEYYSDPSHLNRYGAAAVAKRLAEKQQILWPSPENLEVPSDRKLE